jgi:hypothetical protein
MSDETPATKKPRTTKASQTPFERAVSSASADADTTDAKAEPVEAEVVEVVETPDETVVVEETPVEVVEPVDTPATTVGAQPQVIYVTQPTPPARKGNRGFGAILALVSALVFGVLLALAAAVIGYIAEGVFSFAFVGRAVFYAPVLLFAVAFVLLVLIVNRGSWWAYIVGSIFVGLFVYFGTVGIGMLGAGVIQDPGASAELFRNELLNPFIVVAGLLAREVSMWVGAAISRRGRVMRTRNAEARAVYERDLDEKRAERERLTGAPA